MVTLISTAALAALALFPTALQAQDGAGSSFRHIKIVLNGKSVHFQEAMPFHRDGTVMVALRDVLDRIGGEARWDPGNRTVDAFCGDSRAELVLGSRAAIVNGRAIRLNVAPTSRNGETMVPVEFISQAFGGAVTWNQITNVVTIESPGSSVRTAEITVGARSTSVPRDYRRFVGGGADFVSTRTIKDPEYEEFLRYQDFQRYLVDRVAWLREYQTFREAHPLTAADRSGGLNARYMAYLRFRDDFLYSTDLMVWQQNYNTFLRQRQVQMPTSKAIKMNDYLKDRDSLMQQTDRMTKLTP